MVSIQLDEKTAKTIEAAAMVAGVSISDFVSGLISSKTNVSSRGPWEAIEKQFVEMLRFGITSIQLPGLCTFKMIPTVNLRVSKAIAYSTWEFSSACWAAARR